MLNTLSFAVTLLLLLPNFVGNSIVCYVIFKSNSLRTFYNLQLANLAISDILAGVFILVKQALETFFPMYSHENVVCNLLGNDVLFMICITVSTNLITFIAFSRYLSITRPLKTKSWNKTKHLKIVIPILWLFSVSLSIPKLLADVKQPKGCIPSKLSFVSTVTSVFITTGLGYILPMIILTVTFLRTVRVLWSKSKNSIAGSCRAKLRARRKVTKMLGIVVAAFNVCVLPNTIVVFLLIVFHVRIIEVVYDGTFLLLVTGTAINPYIYWFHSKKFRRETRSILNRSSI